MLAGILDFTNSPIFRDLKRHGLILQDPGFCIFALAQTKTSDSFLGSEAEFVLYVAVINLPSPARRVQMLVIRAM